MLQAVRARPDLVTNALGSALAENRGLSAYLPALSQKLLGEELRIWDGRRWWLGDPAARAHVLAESADFAVQIEAKRARRLRDEAAKPLAAYRDEELANMRRNFYGFDPSYHVARYRFVVKSPNSWTPRHLALHRELDWRVPGRA
jgi:uncharacterized circularly permuted ATP-grasp superfamily protein